MNQKHYLNKIQEYATLLLVGGIEIKERDEEALMLVSKMLGSIMSSHKGWNPTHDAVEFVKNHYGFEKDNDGQTVIYLGDSDWCKKHDDLPTSCSCEDMDSTEYEELMRNIEKFSPNEDEDEDPTGGESNCQYHDKG